MKKILIISFYFPPTGLTGNIRITKFVKYLPTFGITPYIITADENIYGAKDYSSLQDIPIDAKVYRVSSFYLMNYMEKFKFLKMNQIISFINARFFWPDGSIFWAKKAFKNAIKIIEDENIDTILTSGPPFSNHLVGLWIKKWYQNEKTNNETKLKNKLNTNEKIVLNNYSKNNNKIKWIADFRDEWTTNPYTQYYFIRRLYESSLQGKVLSNADSIICISEEMKKSFLSFYPEIKSKISIISNGYDEEDFTNYQNKKNTYEENNSEILSIVYTGTIYKGRLPDNLFKAINLIKKNNPINFEKLKITFIGHDSYFIRRGIKKYKLESIVEIKKRVPHNEVFERISEYDILLLLIGRGNKAKKIITGKFYEYLRLKKPILTLGPTNSDVASILKETDSGVIVDFDDIEKIKSEIENFIELKKNKMLYSKFNFNDEKISQFERKNLTKKLAEIILS